MQIRKIEKRQKKNDKLKIFNKKTFFKNRICHTEMVTKQAANTSHV